HYTYDAVGNRMTQETLDGTNTYTYDDANRLTSVDGVDYSWDADGNLLDDGVSAYAYDHANRLVSVVQGADSYSFSYRCNGKSTGLDPCGSDRVSQTLNGVTTDYVLDQAAGLTQVLSDGTISYLYGIGRVGEEQPTGWQYHLADALGSLRQLANATGTVTLARSYAPFGGTLSTVGAGQTSFAFTGEQLDATGLTYLRSRYLLNAVGRFLSPDPWQGNPDSPLSYHFWLYVGDNPVNLTDPSGLLPPSPQDYRNLTDWLVREMRANANSPQVLQIAQYNQIARWVEPVSPSVGRIFKGLAYSDWANLVGDGKRWDFKDAINDLIPEKTVALCHQNGCEWFEYSVPGNIHYGYVGRAAGFTSLELHLGASYAEVRDPDKRVLKELMPLLHQRGIDIDCLLRNLSVLEVHVNLRWWRTGFDDPEDFAAVSLGTSVFDNGPYPSNLGSFPTILKEYSPRMAHQPQPLLHYFNPHWPYANGYFDGGR
ncbi:MAG: RHS repeat-associated core domain-containing protein, partial [Anaerolineales bacterium]